MAYKRLLPIAIAIIIAVGGYGAWKYYYARPSALGMKNIVVEVESVRRGSIAQKLDLVGTLIADQNVTLKPEIRGKIKKINFTGGQFVEEGMSLIELEDTIYRAKLKEAEAHVNLTKSEAMRQAKLLEKNAGSQRNKEKADSEFQMAEARLLQAQHELDSTIIRAPFSGFVSLNNFSVGAYIDPNIELLTLVDSDPIKIDFRLPANHLRRINTGQLIDVTVDSFPGETLKATIESIDSKVDPNAHTVAVRAAIANPSGKLKPGLFGHVKIVVGAKDNVLLIPDTALQSKGREEEYVFTAREMKLTTGETQLVAVKTPVVTELNEGGNVEVQRGLAEGDRVITVGSNLKIRHGYPIKILDPTQFDAEAEDDEE